MKEVCVFLGMKNDDARKDEQKLYKCVHGKILNWENARRALGLPVERPKSDKQ